MRPLFSVFAAFIFVALPVATARGESWQTDLVRSLKNGSALAVDSSGNVLFESRGSEKLIPASTLKIATIACALRDLGPEYRFLTEFAVDGSGTLFVRGFGDPTLVSEEIARIAKALAPKLKSLRAIVLDDSYFAPELFPDGQSDSTNPYDSMNGALVANFNTVFLRRRGATVESAEAQTPLVPVAKRMGTRMKANIERINIGKDRENTLRYFGEILGAFLEKEGTRSAAAAPVSAGSAPPGATLIYTHRSSATLAEAAKPILDFSTNFSANQIFLILGAKAFGAPATFEKGARTLKACLRETAGWEDAEIVEGAGLSRKNRVSARQMVALLKYFEPNAALLPLEKGKFNAKTGSLRGVGTLAGYMRVPGREGVIRFAILVNDDVSFQYKFVLAEKLYNALAVNRSSGRLPE